MDESSLTRLLERVAAGVLAPHAAADELRGFEDLGFARVDHARALRQGATEVILGQGKTPHQVAAIARQINGLDGAKFDECLASRRNLAKIQAHLKLGEARGVNGTPTFFLGNQQFGGMAINQLKKVLDDALAAANAPAPAGTAKKP